MFYVNIHGGLGMSIAEVSGHIFYVQFGAINGTNKYILNDFITNLYNTVEKVTGNLSGDRENTGNLKMKFVWSLLVQLSGSGTCH